MDRILLLPSQKFGTYASSEEPNIGEKSRKNSSSSQASLQDFKKEPNIGEKSRKNSSSSLQDFKNWLENSKKEKELDPEVLERRQKQIDYGKNTLAYQNYIRQIPKAGRPNHLPRTPIKNLKNYSRNQWDGSIKAWKKSIQLWNNDRDERNKQRAK